MRIMMVILIVLIAGCAGNRYNASVSSSYSTLTDDLSITTTISTFR